MHGIAEWIWLVVNFDCVLTFEKFPLYVSSLTITVLEYSSIACPVSIWGILSHFIWFHCSFISIQHCICYTSMFWLSQFGITWKHYGMSRSKILELVILVFMCIEFPVWMHLAWTCYNCYLCLGYLVASVFAAVLCALKACLVERFLFFFKNNIDKEK